METGVANPAGQLGGTQGGTQNPTKAPTPAAKISSPRCCSGYSRGRAVEENILFDPSQPSPSPSVSAARYPAFLPLPLPRPHVPEKYVAIETTTPGDGVTYPQPGDTVRVHYTGRVRHPPLGSPKSQRRPDSFFSLVKIHWIPSMGQQGAVLHPTSLSVSKAPIFFCVCRKVYALVEESKCTNTQTHSPPFHSLLPFFILFSSQQWLPNALCPPPRLLLCALSWKAGRSSTAQ